MKQICTLIKAKGLPEQTTLYEHLYLVALVAEKIAPHFNLDPHIARLGAILHDIGKASTVFQTRLTSNKKPDTPFRHEIASCFFISLFNENIHPQLIEMVIAHHKSVVNDARDKGLLDLEEQQSNPFGLHIKEWEKWKDDALTILQSFGVETRDITIKEAEDNYSKVVEYCEDKVKEQGYSEWRGLLMAADHFASALSGKTDEYLGRLFNKPNLDFFKRTSKLYPLSLISADSAKKHTMVVACTGAGKTDYLFRRCKGRVFYTLPFQASINAMYKRVKNDLLKDNPDLDIRLLHSASSIVLNGKSHEEKIIQGHVGASIKVLTPHQIAAIAFGTNGYEAMLMDIKGCDVILDEIHSYTNVTRAIVLKIVEILHHLNCNIHIGTATMPSVLYNKIIGILGKENVLEVKLENNELDKFNRHTTHKISDWNSAQDLISEAISDNKKVLVVCNRVRNAQDQYKILSEKYPDTPILLLHSRFKRGDRDLKERQLIGLDENSNSTHMFNTSDKACIVVSTQVVEVSIDISFDIMITEAAPLDGMIQRFGRVNRKRDDDTIGKYKPVYVIAPPDDKKEALPYDVDVLKRSYNVLPNADVLTEVSLQQKIDAVFPDIDFTEIESHSVFKNTGKWNIDKLTHNRKAILLDLLEIDSVSCICEADEQNYLQENYEERIQMEISTRFWVVKGLRQLNCGSRPFIIPDSAYTAELGFETEKAKAGSYNPEYSFL
ncbi:CRISPR-associated helicase/endonuclease Cas3 [Labilibaculum manganireducens]|uniref:CRISPR-associated helicase/endonuclease Cas3 n=1 Tax=Labilibaculum manganireducens TaxID=1940525 RepID=A0A2N3IBU1_9BACT|nr:CRISPR-associated helicase/endonuclease Cas3 [Labilibaculum manganireducens]PKQ67781.1 CRISPR-associated helicase/endonuclease Cas3 [Labilibaculum manganireducens]